MQVFSVMCEHCAGKELNGNPQNVFQHLTHEGKTFWGCPHLNIIEKLVDINNLPKKEGTAMAKIAEIEKEKCGDRYEFLIKSCRAMQKIAIKYAEQSWHRGDRKEIDKEFEEEMKGEGG